MAARRTTFGKTQREREKRAKQVAKREKKQAMSEMEPEEATPDTTAPVDQEAVISQLEKLHERYADGGMSLDDFEAAREELLARLTV